MNSVLIFIGGILLGAFVGFFAAVLCVAARNDWPWEKTRPDPEDEEN